MIRVLLNHRRIAILNLQAGTLAYDNIASEYFNIQYSQVLIGSFINEKWRMESLFIGRIDVD